MLFAGRLTPPHKSYEVSILTHTRKSRNSHIMRFNSAWSPPTKVYLSQHTADSIKLLSSIKNYITNFLAQHMTVPCMLISEEIIIVLSTQDRRFTSGDIRQKQLDKSPKCAPRRIFFVYTQFSPDEFFSIYF